MGQGIIQPPAYQRPNGKLYLSAQQDDIANTTWTLVELNTIFPNFIDGIENTGTHRITPGPSGFYYVSGLAIFRNIVADSKYQVAVYKNDGGSGIFMTNKHSSHNDFLYVPCSDIIFLAKDDFLDLRVYHNAGVGTVDISQNSRLTVQRVR